MSGESTHDALLRLAHEKREMHERRYIERFGLCPDHRDKPTGVCPLCTIETRTRERDANAQTAKAMCKLHDEAEEEIEELHAAIARLAVKAGAGRGVSCLAALERVAAEAWKLATLIPATSWHLDGLNEALAVLDGK